MGKQFTTDPYYDSPEWRDLRRRVRVRDKGLCRYCGAIGHQADHVIPRSRGGPDNVTNLVCCCEPCNRTARANLFASFEEKRTWILAHRGLVKMEQTPRPIKKRKEHVVPVRKLTGLRRRLALKNLPPHVKEALWRESFDKSQS